MTPPEEPRVPGSREHFLDEVAAERVYVGGLGVGSGEAWVTVIGDESGAYGAQFTSDGCIYRALARGLIKFDGGRVRLVYPRPSGSSPP